MYFACMCSWKAHHLHITSKTDASYSTNSQNIFKQSKLELQDWCILTADYEFCLSKEEKKASLDIGKAKPVIVSIFLSLEWRHTLFLIEKAVVKS